MDQKSNVVEIPYKIKFTNKEPIPVDKLVESLLAYEKLIKRVGPFIEEAYSGVYVIDIDVLVSKIESGSLLEELLVKVVFTTPENYEKAKEVIATVLEGNRALTVIVGIGVAAYIGFGVKNAIQGGSPTSQSPTTHIEAYQGAIVQTGGTMNISEKAIDRILNKVSDKKTLTKEAISAVSPAHLESDAFIEFNESQDLTITPDFVREAPAEYTPPELDEQNEVFKRTEVEIWASDKESNTRAWAGIVPGKIEKRIRFSLDDAIHPDDVHGNRTVTADIVIVSAFDKSKKEYVPKRVEILRVYKPVELSAKESP